MKKQLLCLIAAIIIALITNAQVPFLVKDINPGSGSSMIGGYYNKKYGVLNGELYFFADNGTSGYELWKSNGTAAGTVMVKDINPGSAASFNSFSAYTTYFVLMNGNLFFVADDGVNGTELWKTDGTAAGTVMVKDINPGAASCVTFAYSDKINFNNILYFNADNGTNGMELWRSDGTDTGTYMLKDINLTIDTNSFPNYFTISNGILFFDARDGVSIWYLWKTDGTASGTVAVADITPSSGPVWDRKLFDFNNTLFLGDAATLSSTTSALWKSDGTSGGTVEVKDINSVSSDGISDFTIVNNILYFSAIDTILDTGLWKTNGTTAGTVKVKDIYPGYIASYIGELADFNGTLFFAADDSVNGAELWKSDGTTAGTVMVKNIQSPNTSGGSYPMYLTPIGNTLYFSATDTAFITGLWKTDGTTAGTVLVKNFNAGGTNVVDFINLNGTLYFLADDGTTGIELWALNTNTGINENKTEAGKIVISPNPSSGNLQITIYDLRLQNAQLKIFDVLGKLVFQSKIVNLKSEIHPELPGGMYFYQITNNQLQVANGKLVITD